MATPPTNTYIIKGNDIAFGIPSGVTVPWGVLTSRKRKPTKTIAEFTDQDGDIGTRVSHQYKEVYTLEVIRGGIKGVKVADLPVPALDDVVQMDGKYMIISDMDDSEAQGDAQKYSVELTWYPKIDLSPEALAAQSGAPASAPPANPVVQQAPSK